MEAELKKKKELQQKTKQNKRLKKQKGKKLKKPPKIDLNLLTSLYEKKMKDKNKNQIKESNIMKFTNKTKAIKVEHGKNQLEMKFEEYDPANPNDYT